MPRKRYTPEEIKVVLDAHWKWLKGEDGGLRANLTRANLTRADLRGAVLTDAVLTRAVLTGAVLTGADLTGADLRGAVLTDAVLTPICDDLYEVLSAAPVEVPALIAALDAGRVNGSTYSDGECGCLFGTLAIAAGADPQSINACAIVHGLRGDVERPIERFFTAIKRGDTPETNQVAKLVRDWAAEWLSRMQLSFGGKAVYSCD